MISYPEILRQTDCFIALCICRIVVSAKNKSNRGDVQRIHQCSSLANLACIRDRVVGSRQCAIWIPKYPQGYRPKRQQCH